MLIGIVLTGYYFKYKDLYQKIIIETQLYNNCHFNLFILSHKNKEEIPVELFEYLANNGWEIIFRPNIGWDWGCHVQFIQWYKQSDKPDLDFILFLHDDISITKNGFIKAFLNKAEQGLELIGNSKPFTTIDNFEKDYSDEAFILEKRGLEFASGPIKIVRGSTLFMSSKLAEKGLLNLPFQKYGSISLANRSLRMFGAVVTKLIGGNKVGYLSEEHFRSYYIVEEMRGDNIKSNFFIRRFFRQIIMKLFHLADKYCISKIILKHNYPAFIENMLQINFSRNNILPGYLNICFENNFCSDIDIEDFEKLLTENRIFKIIFSNNIVFDELAWFKRIIMKLARSKTPIDIFIEAKDLKSVALRRFRRENNDIKLNIEKIPKRKGTKWVNRLYLKYPQNNLKPV